MTCTVDIGYGRVSGLNHAATLACPVICLFQTCALASLFPENCKDNTAEWKDRAQHPHEKPKSLRVPLRKI